VNPKKVSKSSQYGGNTGIRDNNLDMNIGGNMAEMNQNPQSFYPMYMQQFPQMMYYNQQQGMPQSNTYFFTIYRHGNEL